MSLRKIAAAVAVVLGVLAAARAQEAGAPPQGQQQQARPKPAPRVLVLTFGRADQGELAPKVQGLAEETLLDLRFPLVDESQVLSRFQLDDLERFLFLTPERARIAELKARFGAELVLVVQYTRIFQYEKEFYGARSRFFKNDVRVKAILADTAEVVHSGGAEGLVESRQSNLEEITRQEVRRAAEKVLERWSYEAVGPSTYQVLARGVPHDALARVAEALRARPGVRDVVERDYGGEAAGAGNGLLEVKFQGRAEELSAALGALADPKLAILAASANRIEVGLPGGAPPAAPQPGR